MEEKAAHPSHKWTINSGSGTTEESPSILAEMRHRRIGMVQEGEHDDPVVGEKVRDEVVLGERGEARLIGPGGEECDP